jgi:transposase InsO family protein
LLQRLQELAAERRRFGYRRLDIFLRRDGIVANHKRIYRVYAEANLQVRKRLKRRVALGRGDLPQNAFVESFNGKFRDECLNDNVFTSIAEAREIIERWRVDYNECRPHRSLGQMTPSAFAIDQNRSLTTISL